MKNILEVVEGARYQTSDETIVYSVTTTNLVSNPTSPTAVVYDESVDLAVTDTVMPSGSHSAASDVITFKPMTALTKGHSYRVEFKFTVASSVFERYFRVVCPI